ncbi:MAG: hypothetical protein ACFB13_23440 [Kiloniellaceae bacterium]
MAEQLEIEDFDTAKAVFEKLRDVPAERRKRILNWVAEGLGIVLRADPMPATHAHSAVAPPATSTFASPSGYPQQNPMTDIKTFVAAKTPKSDVQFAATVAYYYQFEAPEASRRETIDGNALQEAARLAGRHRLGNPRATLNNAKSLGYLDGISRGEFTINSVGENLVAMTLPGTSEAGGAGNSMRAKRAKKSKTSKRVRKSPKATKAQKSRRKG